jgi:hypothetical protein
MHDKLSPPPPTIFTKLFISFRQKTAAISVLSKHLQKKQNLALSNPHQISKSNLVAVNARGLYAAQNRTQRRFCAGDHGLVLLDFSRSCGSSGEDDNSKCPQRSRIWNFAPASRIF